MTSWLTTHFRDASFRGAAYLLRAAGFLSGGVSPEKLLEVITSAEFERTLQALRAAIEADPHGARAVAGQVLDEIARRGHGTSARPAAPQVHHGPYRGAPRPPSPKQVKFLEDLGHSNPAAIRTSREADLEIKKRLPQQPAR